MGQYRGAGTHGGEVELSLAVRVDGGGRGLGRGADGGTDKQNDPLPT